VFNFNMGEERRVAEIGFATGADIIAVVRFVSAPPTSTALLKGMLQTGWEHCIIKYSYQTRGLVHLPISMSAFNNQWTSLLWWYVATYIKLEALACRRCGQEILS
jgi:hypothetical protein